jgi:hypothetical protein
VDHEAGCCGCDAIAVIGGVSGTGDGADIARRHVDTAYAECPVIDDVKIAAAIEEQGRGPFEGGVGGRPSVAAGVRCARQNGATSASSVGCGDDSVGVDDANPVIVIVADIGVAAAVKGNALGRIQSGIDGEAVVSREARGASASEGLHGRDQLQALRPGRSKGAAERQDENRKPEDSGECVLSKCATGGRKKQAETVTERHTRGSPLLGEAATMGARQVLLNELTSNTYKYVSGDVS